MDSALPISTTNSYRYCARVARQAASSFYWSFWLLPPAKRRAMLALYAFSRQTDDLSDNELPTEQRRAALAEWRRTLRLALGGAPAEGAFPALVDSVRRFGIPENLLFDVIDGVEMDLDPRRYETFDDLSHYCEHVASAVGLACLSIWGFEEPLPREAALKCGYAFQLTNILRDLGEDAERNRVYLPLADLRQFGYSPEELLRGVADERFQALLQFELERAERLFDESAELFDALRPDGRRALRLMVGTYRELLRQIQVHAGSVFTQRVRLDAQQKVQILFRCLWGG